MSKQARVSQKNAETRRRVTVMPEIEPDELGFEPDEPDYPDPEPSPKPVAASPKPKPAAKPAAAKPAAKPVAASSKPKPAAAKPVAVSPKPKPAAASPRPKPDAKPAAAKPAAASPKPEPEAGLKKLRYVPAQMFEFWDPGSQMWRGPVAHLSAAKQAGGGVDSNWRIVWCWIEPDTHDFVGYMSSGDILRYCPK